MSRRRTVVPQVLEVDGVPIRLCGAAPLTDQARAALTDVIQAVTAAAEQLPALCRQFDPDRPGPGFRGLPCLEPLGHDGPHLTGNGRTW